MTEERWLDDCSSATGLILHLDPQRYDRKLRLFAVACCRMVWDQLTEPAIRDVIEASERYADDPGTFADLRRATERLHHLPWDQPRILALRVAAVRCKTFRDRRNEYSSAVGTMYPLLAGFKPDAAIFREVDPNEFVFEQSHRALTEMLRDIVGNPFRPVPFEPNWRTAAAVGLAAGIYNSRDFVAAPILADALQDAGCDDDAILSHLRGPWPHARGCWAVDAVLGKA